MASLGRRPRPRATRMHRGPQRRIRQLLRHANVVLNTRPCLKPTDTGRRRRGNLPRPTTHLCHRSRTPTLRAGFHWRREQKTPVLARHRGATGLGPLNSRNDVPRLGVPLWERHGRATPLRRAMRCLHSRPGPPSRRPRSARLATTGAGKVRRMCHTPRGRLLPGRRSKATTLRRAMLCLHARPGPPSWIPRSARR